MPPYDLWIQGRAAIARWLSRRGAGCAGSRLVPVAASDSIAFAQYRDGGAIPWGLVVLEVADERIMGCNTFLDTERLFPKFGLPMRLESVG